MIKNYKRYKIGRFSKVAYFWIDRKYLTFMEIAEFDKIWEIN